MYPLSTDSSSTWALDLLTQTLQQCEQVNLSSFYNLNIVITIFYGIGYWCLLVVVVWTLNSMLRERLDRKWRISQAICLAIVVFMGLFTCVHVGLQCYHLWLNTWAGLYSNKLAYIEEQTYIGLAFWVLYLTSVLVSGAFALLAMQSMRPQRISGGVSLLLVTQPYPTDTFLGATGLGHHLVRFAERLVSHYDHTICQANQPGGMGVDRQCHSLLDRRLLPRS